MGEEKEGMTNEASWLAGSREEKEASRAIENLRTMWWQDDDDGWVKTGRRGRES